MRELYIILSVVGWFWCLIVAVCLWVRLRRAGDTGPGDDVVRDTDVPPPEPQGGEEVRA